MFIRTLALAGILAALMASVVFTNDWMTAQNREVDLREKQAWLSCIGDTDQASAGNLVCRSLYPTPYKLFETVYNAPA